MSFSIYELDDEIKQLIDTDNFLTNTTVNDFVELISKNHLLKGAEVNKLEYLDPKPYIRTFEATLREIKNLSNEAEARREQLEREVNEYELKHSSNVLDLSDKVENVTHQFSNLDFRISQVSNQIDPLNTSLNKITNSRDVSIETIFLIRAYHGFFTKDSYDPLEVLRTSRKYEDKLKCARTVNNLLSLAKKIETPEIAKTSQCVKTIEKFNELMERDLLTKFESALENDEYEVMKEISNILDEYNGGANVIQTFVNQSDFLNDISDENLSLLENEHLWNQLSDPSQVVQVNDDQFVDLLDHLKVSMRGQARVVAQIFSRPVPVLKIFIQRIYAQQIQIRINSTLQYSLSVNALAHVRILQYLYQLINDFTKDIKEFFSTNDFDEDNELSLILDQAFYDLFIECTSESAYFNREKKSLEDIIYGAVSKLTQYNERALTTKALSTVLENLDNLDYNQAEVHSRSLTDRFKMIERKRYNQFKDFMKSHIPDMNNRNSIDLESTPDYQQYSNLNMAVVETVVKSVIESVARILEVEPNRSSDDALEVLEIFLFDFGRLYIEGELEIVYDHLKQESKQTSINFSYLKSFHLLSDSLYLVSSCIKKILVPCATNNPNIRNRMINLTNSYIKRSELSINIILNDTVDLINDKLVYFLSKQKRKDFLADNIIEDDTEACELISEFLTKTYDSLKDSLTDANLLNVLNKIGYKFLNLLLEHFKKFTVNSTGGIILTKDVIRYQSVIDSWEVADLSENFQILKEIGNLFTVHPNLINSLVTEGQLATLKPFTIRQYISKRTDFNPSYLERFFSFK